MSRRQTQESRIAKRLRHIQLGSASTDHLPNAVQRPARQAGLQAIDRVWKLSVEKTFRRDDLIQRPEMRVDEG